VKIAVVHSQYRSAHPSGENIAVEQQTEALRQAGHDILEIYRSTDVESQKRLYTVRSALSLATGLDFQHPDRAITQFAPDIVQVHNTVPNFGTRWLAQLPTPVVTTLHNFRVSCANGLLYRDGKICVACPTTGSASAAFHGCYQGSRVASLPAAIATAGGASKNRLIRASAAVISQSIRVHEFMLKEGLPGELLHLIPGFVESRHAVVADPPSKPAFIFVGRITPEKGLNELLAIWPGGFRLDIVGTGDVRASGTGSPSDVRYLGVQSRDWISAALPLYSALVFPGRVWEGAYPLVVREALEAGIPVVALDGSGAADLVHSSGAGAVYDDGSRGSLVKALQHSMDGGHALRLKSRSVYDREMTRDAWAARMTALYRQVQPRVLDSQG
jgi:glycosyltransferase involved in cell wall biosynthesis